VGEPWQALVGKSRVSGRELRVAIGREIDRGEALVVQRIREGQRDGGYRVVSMITDVGRAWHDAATYLIEHVLADARRGR